MTQYGKLTAACIVTLAAILTAAVHVEWKGLDVVRSHSLTAFGAIMEAVPDAVTRSGTGRWSLTAPDKAARFIWGGNDGHGVFLEVSAEPFLKAGLDPKTVSGEYVFSPTGMDGAASGGAVLTIGAAPKQNAPVRNGGATALTAYEQLVAGRRDILAYHAVFDHYGVQLGDGNMFEWAKNPAINGYDNTSQDKDIVFVLHPEPLIRAGVDPANVEGWAYAQIPVETNGKTERVWKFLKAFDVK